MNVQPGNLLRLTAGMLTMLGVLAFAPLQDRQPKPLALPENVGGGSVYVVPIEGMIDKPLANYLDRAIGDAESERASLLLLHIDTFGGLVDAADQMRKAILNSKVFTVAFIDRNAASAGALISYAADRIVMAPGSSIGAATVVEGAGGEAAPDKYQSYMRGLMRATAEANGRDPAIAEAMVDEDIFVAGVSDSGKVLTLSAREALDLGVADALLNDTDAVISAFDLNGREVVRHRATTAEEILRFFANPVIQSILMLMMLGGLYFEMQSPGVGLPGLLAVTGALLFFAPSYLLGLVESWEIVLFFVGVVLIMVEIFILPGFGFAGIVGITLVIGALIAALIGNIGFQFPSGREISSAIATMAITLVLLVVLIFSLARYLPRSERFNHLVLAPDLSSAMGYTSADTFDELLGQFGTALTPLHPGGAAEFDGNRFDVITAGEYITTGSRVKVVRVRGGRIEVRRADFESLPSETSAS